MKKTLSLMLLVAMMSTLMVGCGAKKEDTTAPVTEKAKENTAEALEEVKAEELDYVKLKMYFLGGAPDDMDKVWGEINAKLKEKVNAEVEPVILGWGDWADRYPLLFVSGEEWDMAYTANWAFYAQQAAKGGFLELTPEMLNQYAPMTMATLPEAAFNSTKVNGGSYMIPANSKWAIHEGVTIRGDLREKYGLPEIKTVEDLEKYMDAVLANESNMIPLADVGSGTETIRPLLLTPQEQWFATDGIGTLVFNYGKENELVTTPGYELEGTLDYMKKMVEWRKKGYWSRSALTYTGNLADQFKAGKGAVVISNLEAARSIWDDAKTNNPDWKIEYVDLTGGKRLPAGGFGGNGSAIHATSKNPERALMVLDLLGYDPEINYLLMQGIPGVHTNNVGTDEVRKIEVLSPTYGGSYSQWCFDNFKTRPLAAFEGYEALADSYFEDKITFHPGIGMTFNPDNVKAEVAATTQVIEQYKPIINLGFGDDAEKTLNDYIKALKDAGIEKVDAELRAQLQAQFDAAK